MIKEMYQEYEHKMKKTVEVVISDFGGVRAGRANASVLDKISVEYYGTETPINQVASISAPDPRTLVIQPWDGTLLKAIEKALLISELGINPQNDGKVIRLVFPQLTEERRKELTKQVQNASDNLRSAQMSMEDTEDQLNNYTITSPISGTVISKEVKAGDTVSNTAGSTSLCTIYDLSYLQMTVNVDELEILSIKEGQSVTITADAISDRTFTGVVTSVSKAGTTAGGTTTYPVAIRINDTGDLLPGMNATAEITTASTENALSIPNAAVARGNYVLVTKDSPSAANADPSMTAPEGYVYVKVTTGTSDDDYIAVTSGLQEGDTVAYTASSTASVSADGQMEEMMVVGGPGQGGGGSGGPSGGAPGGGPQ